MHRTTSYKGSEVDSDKSDAINKLDHQLFGFGVVAGCLAVYFEVPRWNNSK